MSDARADGLRHGPLPADAIHLCVDMQRLFAENTAWKTPWMERVLPKVEQLVAHDPAQTIFTRFIPADHPGEGRGVWKRYWRRWADITLARLDRELIELAPSLSRHAPPALVIDKRTYSPWLDRALEDALARRGARVLIVSGGETDVCVLATVLGAVDRGYRVIVVKDALCSSSDETHEALITLYEQRFTEQIETVTTDQALAAWESQAARA